MIESVLDVIDACLEGVDPAIEDSGDAIALLDLRVHEPVCMRHHLSFFLLQPLSNILKGIGHLLLDGLSLVYYVSLSRI